MFILKYSFPNAFSWYAKWFVWNRVAKDAVSAEIFFIHCLLNNGTIQFYDRFIGLGTNWAETAGFFKQLIISGEKRIL